MSANASTPPRFRTSANARSPAAQSPASSEPAPVSATISALTIAGWARAKFSAMFPIFRCARSACRSATDVASQPLEVPPHPLVELLDFLLGLRLGERILVEDLALGDLGLVDVSRLGDADLLRVCERALLLDRGLPVLLAQPLHRELVRCLRAVARHRASQYSTGRPGRRRGLPGTFAPPVQRAFCS